MRLNSTHVGNTFYGAVCLTNANYPNLTEGKAYTVEVFEGIFHSSPFVSVVGDHGKAVVCHACRFELPN